MFFNPFAQSVVIVCCHKENEQVNILDLLLHFFGVFVDYLPSEPKGYQYSYYGDSGERKHDVGHHLAHHGPNAVLGVVKVMEAFQGAMRHRHVQRSESEEKRRVFIFKLFFILLVFFPVESSKSYENQKKQAIGYREVEFIF